MTRTILLILLSLILVGCVKIPEKERTDFRGVISEKTNDYVIAVVFEGKHLLKNAIPTEVINYCESLTPKKKYLSI
jgi:hypothetical protein